MNNATSLVLIGFMLSILASIEELKPQSSYRTAYSLIMRILSSAIFVWVIFEAVSA
jgi:hypothetical protein